MKDGARLDWAEARLRLARMAESVARAGERSAAGRERVLQERAARLARPAAPPGETAVEELLIAAVGEARFAIPLAAIVEVVRGANCSPVPLAPPVLAGVIQVRGEIRPVFHLSRAYGIAEPEAGGAPIVLLARAGDREAGLLVDRVEDVRRAGAERRPAPAGMTHVLWMTPDLIPVLDPARIFPEEME